MTHDRTYRLSAAGRIASGSYVESISDDEAYLLVQTMLNEDGTAEVWGGVRWIGVVSGSSERGMLP